MMCEKYAVTLETELQNVQKQVGADPCRGFRCPKCGACGVMCLELGQRLEKGRNIQNS